MTEPTHQQPELPPSVLTEFARSGAIAAIVELRRLQPELGLAEAKARLDAYRAKPGVELPESVLDALRSGERLRAVRTLGELTGLGLVDAVEAIDARMQADLRLRETYLAACGLDTVVRVSFQDGLSFPSGSIAPAAYRCVVFCRVPADWVPTGTFDKDVLEAVFELLYGDRWRHGNVDGSRYVVRDIRSERLTPDKRDWLAAIDSPTQRHWYAHAMADGGFGKVDGAKF